MMSTLILTCLCFIGVSMVNGTSQAVLDFLTYYNGHWDNKPQFDECEGSKKDFDFIKVWVIPMDIPALRPHPAMLTEEVSNGVVRVLNMGVVFDGPFKNSVVVRLYNFTDISGVKPGTYNADSLLKLTMNDLHGEAHCESVFQIVEPGFMSGNFPYCRYTINGKPLRFSLSITCNHATTSFPVDTEQKSPMLPYVFRRIGPRYPLVFAPEGYISPCNHTIVDA